MITLRYRPTPDAPWTHATFPEGVEPKDILEAVRAKMFPGVEMIPLSALPKLPADWGRRGN